MPPWRTRAFGDLTDAALNRAIARNDRLAEDRDALARKDEVAARALAEQLERDAAGGETRGQAYAAEAGLLLDQADVLVSTAHREMDTAANMKLNAEKRTEWLAELVKAEQKGRITLRLAGTSRKEQELSGQYTGERAAAVQEQHRAENAARDALREAWTLIQGSQFAGALGAGQYQPAPADTAAAADRFAEMRTAAARAGNGIDVRDQQRVGRLTGNAATQRGEAERARAQSAQARAEVATKFPRLHDLESAGRASLQQQRAAQEAQQAAVRARNEASTTYTPPSQGRSSGRSR